VAWGLSAESVRARARLCLAQAITAVVGSELDAIEPHLVDAELIATTPAALTALSVVGGLYLVWLGTKSMRHPATLGGRVDEPTGTARGMLLRGMAVSGLNPKGLLIFVVLLPQFAHPHAPWPVPAQIAVLGLAFTLTCGVVYLAVGAAARGLLLARPTAAWVVSRISGASVIILGLALLAGRLMT
jgi:threonine/homoserine/homoserine lactone efflux protein